MAVTDKPKEVIPDIAEIEDHEGSEEDEVAPDEVPDEVAPDEVVSGAGGNGGMYTDILPILFIPADTHR